MQSFMVMLPDGRNDMRLTAFALKSHQVCMHGHTETTREGMLLHDWFTSKHRLISVVSSSPSQAVSTESAVSEELPRFISTHVNGNMSTCKQDCGTMTQKTVIENRNTANTQPTTSSHAVFYSYWSSYFPTLPFPA